MHKSSVASQLEDVMKDMSGRARELVYGSKLVRKALEKEKIKHDLTIHSTNSRVDEARV